MRCAKCANNGYPSKHDPQDCEDNPAVDILPPPCSNCGSSAFPAWEDPDGALVCTACRVDDHKLVEV